MELKQKIKRMIKKSPQGLSITNIQTALSVGRIQIKVALARLIGEGKVYERAVGNALLHYYVYTKKGDDSDEVSKL